MPLLTFIHLLILVREILSNTYTVLQYLIIEIVSQCM